MRHSKQKFQLGVKKEHRLALMANLAAALFKNDRIETTLVKAKALRPFSEKLITLACKAARSEDASQKLHFRRLAIAQLRDQEALKALFDEKVSEFLNRHGGYTRIYKLVARRGDASPMALIELVKAEDKGYKKARRSKKSVAKKASAVAESQESSEKVAVAE